MGGEFMFLLSTSVYPLHPLQNPLPNFLLPSSVLNQAKGALMGNQRARKSYSFFVKGKLSRSF